MPSSSRALPADLFDRVVARLRAEEPELQGVLVGGSYARDEQDGFSNLDLVALTAGAPRREQRTWFEPLPDGRLLHVSIEARALAAREAGQPASWAIGFPAIDQQRWVWGSPQAREMLGADPSDTFPPGDPELEDFVEFHMKVRRAEATGDTVQLRWAARMLAEHAPGLLRELNPAHVVRTPVEALAAGFSLPVAPEHYKEDFSLCGGLAPASDAEIAAAAARFTGEILTFLRDRAAGLSSSGDDIRRALIEGTLHAYVEP